MKADLHMHSTASDGTLTPSQLVSRAASLGFTAMALTDHDSVDGIGEAQQEAARCGMRLIPGVELSCGGQKEIHVLGYGFDPHHDALASFCMARRQERAQRAERMVAQLAQAGAVIDIKRVQELAHGVIGRPHVARALLEAGYVHTISEAFERYIGVGCCGFVPKADVPVAQGAALIAQAGGVAVLAHPMELKMGEAALISLVQAWKAQGLAGMEVYHPSAQNNHAAFLLHLARTEGLLVTGGSDFHGENVRNVQIGQGLERWISVERDMAALLARLNG